MITELLINGAINIALAWVFFCLITDDVLKKGKALAYCYVFAGLWFAFFGFYAVKEAIRGSVYYTQPLGHYELISKLILLVFMTRLILRKTLWKEKTQD
jgi:hypothetical protein